eukprot:15471024-Alexandrium_andersonii.AAC.1
MPASSASPELRAMVFWVVDQCLMARVPRAHTPPHVDLRVRRHPTKSVRSASSPVKVKSSPRTTHLASNSAL